jgi:hypothetical protein
MTVQHNGAVALQQSGKSKDRERIWNRGHIQCRYGHIGLFELVYEIHGRQHRDDHDVPSPTAHSDRQPRELDFGSTKGQSGRQIANGLSHFTASFDTIGRVEYIPFGSGRTR